MAKRAARPSQEPPTRWGVRATVRDAQTGRTIKEKAVEVRGDILGALSLALERARAMPCPDELLKVSISPLQSKERRF